MRALPLALPLALLSACMAKPQLPDDTGTNRQDPGVVDSTDTTPEPDTSAPSDTDTQSATDPDTGAGPDTVEDTGNGGTTGDTADTGAPPPPAKPWVEMNREERIVFMREVYMPALQALWPESPRPDQTLSCATCHGEDYLEADYALPNKLIAISQSGFPFSESSDPYLADWGVFMETWIRPTSADLFGYELHTPTNPTGFGCYDCHQQAP